MRDHGAPLGQLPRHQSVHLGGDGGGRESASERRDGAEERLAERARRRKTAVAIAFERTRDRLDQRRRRIRPQLSELRDPLLAHRLEGQVLVVALK